MKTHIADKLALIRAAGQKRPRWMPPLLDQIDPPPPEPPCPRQERLGAIARAIGNVHCSLCSGGGIYNSRVCHCVDREVFKIICRQYQAQKWRTPTPNFTHTNFGPAYGIPAMEFRADFEILARRVLDEFHHRLFKLYCLEGREWRTCVKLLSCDRGTFFHAWYRIQQIVGRECLQMKTPMFPVSMYFHSSPEIDPAQIAQPLGSKRKCPVPRAFAAAA